MKTPKEWATETANRVGAQFTGHDYDKLEKAFAKCQADARRTALQAARAAIEELKQVEGGHPSGWFLAKLDDDRLAPDALIVKRAWQAVDRTLLDDAGRS